MQNWFRSWQKPMTPIIHWLVYAKTLKVQVMMTMMIIQITTINRYMYSIYCKLFSGFEKSF